MKRLIKQIPALLCIAFTPLFVAAGSLDHIEIDTSFISIEEGKPKKWKNIAVLPFTGNKLYRKPMAELFTYYIKKQNNYKITDPAVIETELEKIGITYDGTEENALKSGKKLGFDAVITGHITLQYNRWTGFKYPTEIKLLDIKSGKKAAHLIMSPFYFSTSHHKKFSKSTEKTATYMLKILTDSGPWNEGGNKENKGGSNVKKH